MNLGLWQYEKSLIWPGFPNRVLSARLCWHKCWYNVPASRLTPYFHKRLLDDVGPAGPTSNKQLFLHGYLNSYPSEIAPRFAWLTKLIGRLCIVSESYKPLKRGLWWIFLCQNRTVSPEPFGRRRRDRFEYGKRPVRVSLDSAGRTRDRFGMTVW
jgi:hypothetical protein